MAAFLAQGAGNTIFRVAIGQGLNSNGSEGPSWININPTNGNVGIGTTAPTQKLTIAGGGWIIPDESALVGNSELFGAWKQDGSGGWARGIGWLSSTDSILSMIGSYQRRHRDDGTSGKIGSYGRRWYR
jgi:hypothetical protein